MDCAITLLRGHSEDKTQGQRARTPDGEGEKGTEHRAQTNLYSPPSHARAMTGSPLAKPAERAGAHNHIVGYAPADAPQPPGLDAFLGCFLEVGSCASLHGSGSVDLADDERAGILSSVTTDASPI